MPSQQICHVKFVTVWLEVVHVKKLNINDKKCPMYVRSTLSTRLLLECVTKCLQGTHTISTRERHRLFVPFKSLLTTAVTAIISRFEQDSIIEYRFMQLALTPRRVRISICELNFVCVKHRVIGIRIIFILERVSGLQIGPVFDKVLYFLIISLQIHKKLRTKALVLELLAAICLVKGGHEIILNAFDHFKEAMLEKRRFGTLMGYFKHYKEFQIEFMIACMQFINIVVHSVADMNFRVALQWEFASLGLGES